MIYFIIIFLLEILWCLCLCGKAISIIWDRVKTVINSRQCMYDVPSIPVFVPSGFSLCRRQLMLSSQAVAELATSSLSLIT